MTSNANNIIPKMRVYSETLRLLNLELSFGKTVSIALNFSLQPILNAVHNSKDIKGSSIFPLYSYHNYNYIIIRLHN